MSPEVETQRLIWHLCHLCNFATSSISVYLSLVSLARDTNANGGLNTTCFAYPPAMRAQAAMLADGAHNLELARDALMQTDMHLRLLAHGSYRSLVDAANKILATVRMIPQTNSPILAGGALEEACMPKKEVIDEVRVACDELTELCDGNSLRGVTGWKQCWQDVNKQLGLQ